jgi:hypothetical protein
LEYGFLADQEKSAAMFKLRQAFAAFEKAH